MLLRAAFKCRVFAFVGVKVDESLVCADAFFVLLLHEEQAGFQKQSPFVKGVTVNINIFSAVENMIGLVEIFLLNFDLHHHFNRSSYIFLMVIAFQ